MIVLNEVDIDAIFGKILMVVRFEEETAVIGKNLGFNDEEARNGGFLKNQIYEYKK